MNIQPTPMQNTMIEERRDPGGEVKPIASDSLLNFLNNMRDSTVELSTAVDGLDARLDILEPRVDAIANLVGNGNFGPAFRNGIIDGGFEIWDGNRALTNLPNTIPYTGCTMWSLLSNGTFGAKYYMRAPGLTPASTYCLRFGRNPGTADVTPQYLMFDMTSVDSKRFAGQPVVLSFTVRFGASALGGAFNSYIRTGTGTDQAARIISYTGSIQVAKAYNVTGTAQRLFQTSTLSPTLNQIGVFFEWIPIGVAGANDYFEIDDVQLEAGTYATAFEILPFEVTRAQVERFYWKTFDFDQPPVQAVGNLNGCYFYDVRTAGPLNLRNNVPFGTKMRPMVGTPVITTYNPQALNANWRNVSAAADSGVPIVAAFQRSLTINNTQVAGDLVGHSIQIHATVDARL